MWWVNFCLVLDISRMILVLEVFRCTVIEFVEVYLMVLLRRLWVIFFIVVRSKIRIIGLLSFVVLRVRLWCFVFDW